MSWEKLKREDFEDLRLPDHARRIDVLAAVCARALSMHEQAKKKGKYPIMMKNKPSDEDDDDDDDDDVDDSKKIRVPCRPRPPLTINCTTTCGTSTNGMVNKRGKRTDCFNIPDGVKIPKNLPIEYKEKISLLNKGLEVKNEVLVICKKLSSSDVIGQQNRYSIPINHIVSKFLNDEENKILESREENGKNVKKLEVNIIDTKQVRHEVKLARWVMKKPDLKKKKNSGKKSGKRKIDVADQAGTSNESGTSMEKKKKGAAASISYVIIGTSWQTIVASNELKAGDVTQLWAVRVEGTLWFALVKL